MEDDWMTFFEQEARNYAAGLNRTPPPPSGSSERSFATAEEFHTPASHRSSEWAGFSPGTRERPMLIESDDSASSSNTSPTNGTKETPIAPLPTCSDDGKPLEWDSWDAAFDYLLTFSKENQFCVKKGTSRKKDGRKTVHYIGCVKGGQRNYQRQEDAHHDSVSRHPLHSAHPPQQHPLARSLLLQSVLINLMPRILICGCVDRWGCKYL